MEEPKTLDSLTPSQIVWRKFRKNKLAFYSLCLIAFILVLSILGYAISPDKTPFANNQHVELSNLKPGVSVLFVKEPQRINVEKVGIITNMLYGTEPSFKEIPIDTFYYTADSLHVIKYGSRESGSAIVFKLRRDVEISTKTFLLGTDKFGRDMLSRMIIGARISLAVGFIAVLISLLIGVTLGALAGYYRGRVDAVIMWFVNVTWSVPTLLMVIAITLVLGKGFWQMFTAIGLTMWVDVARIVRGQVLSIREKEYIDACRILGFSDFRIITKHILPNTLGAVIIVSAANFASAILIEAGLSFLGIGVQPPIPSWGNMIKDHYGYIVVNKAYLAFIPGIAIMLLMMAFTFVGNGLKDAFDEKM